MSEELSVIELTEQEIATMYSKLEDYEVGSEEYHKIMNDINSLSKTLNESIKIDCEDAHFWESEKNKVELESRKLDAVEEADKAKADKEILELTIQENREIRESKERLTNKVLDTGLKTASLGVSIWSIQKLFKFEYKDMGMIRTKVGNNAIQTALKGLKFW